MAHYPRRQQYRRLRRAAAGAVATVVAVALAVLAAGIGAVAPAAIPLAAALGLALYTRRWLRLARRSAVGAWSEKQVRLALEPLSAEGWRVRHGLSGRGRGDIDHVAIAPTGLAFAIETKTRSHDERHLAAVRDQAEWLGRRRRRWCPDGALPVLCVTRGRIERLERDVLVVSVDHLAAALRARARTSPRPGFLAPVDQPMPR